MHIGVHVRLCARFTDTFFFGGGRLEIDQRRETLASDFGIAPAAVDGNESTFVIAAQAQDSPFRAEPGVEEQPTMGDAVDSGVDAAYDDDQPGAAAEMDGEGEGEEVEVEEQEEEEEDDDDVRQELDNGANDTDIPLDAERSPAKKGKKRKRAFKLSKHGMEYPPLPQAMVKKLAQTFAQTSGMGKTKITPDTLAAIVQASEWFFEQLGDDLEAYARHAGRKTICESDMIMLMRRYVTCRFRNPSYRLFART